MAHSLTAYTFTSPRWAFRAMVSPPHTAPHTPTTQAAAIMALFSFLLMRGFSPSGFFSPICSFSRSVSFSLIVVTS